MTKNYQTETTREATVMPEGLMVAMADIAGAAEEGLLALAVATGFGVLTAMMDEDVTTLCGPKGRHDPQRTAVRHGSEAGSVTLGGRRVPVRRPRVRAADGSGEVAVATYEQFSSTELLGRMAMERMLAKLSARRYHVGLEPVGERVEASATSTSKSAVSRRFVQATERALAELLAADLSSLDLVALMVDGVHFAGHLCVVALGIRIDGTKHPLGLVEGSTENATLVTELMVDLRERGLDTAKPILAVLDGSKALRRAVLEDLARQLFKAHPGAAGSLREGLAETFTVARLGVPPTLARTLRSTNAIESMIEICRDHSANVKRWTDGQMALRWCAAGMVEAAKQFRRVNGFMHLPALRKALDTHIAKTVTPACENEEAAA